MRDSEGVGWLLELGQQGLGANNDRNASRAGLHVPLTATVKTPWTQCPRKAGSVWQ